MNCSAAAQTGICRLEDDQLGVLDLTGGGYITESLHIGHPADRPVARGRALGDGIIDDTAFVGGRAVSIGLRLDTRQADMASLLDALKSYMSPRRRPRLVWSWRGTPTSLRSLPVVGVDAPVALTGSRFPPVVTSWRADAHIESPDTTCKVIVPSSATENGRPYNLVFDRQYPSQMPFGSFVATNDGNMLADWIATIGAGATGTVVNPTLRFNDATLAFNQQGGTTVGAGQTLVIDTRRRTMLLNDDPTEPRFDRSNFLSWNWEDLGLRAGDNVVNFFHAGTSVDAFATICWRSTWL